MTIDSLFGFLAAFCLMLSGIPQVIKTVKQGHADGIAPTFIILLLVGFSSMIYYVAKVSPTIPLIVNYSVNLISYLIIGYYKLFPRR